MAKLKKIVICGGHLTPALAIIDELKTHKDVQLFFFGRKYATEGSKSLSVEFRIITQRGIKFYNIYTGRLQRKFTRFTIPSLFKIPIGFIQSFVFLILARPSLIVSFGGYLSTPVVFAGWLLGIRSITHEQALVAGLANRINSLFVEKIFLAWPAAQKHFDEKKSQVIGNPVRNSIFLQKANSAQIKNFLKKSSKLIYVTGGSLGSHFLNQLMFKSINNLRDFAILHQVGSTNFKNDLATAKKIKMVNYLAVDYVGDLDIGAVLNKASLVVSRAGANTIWELAILSKPAILIPLPIAAGGEQEANAAVLEKAGAAQVINQDDLNPVRLKKAIVEIAKNYQNCKNAAIAFSKTLPRDASKKLAGYIGSLTLYEE